MAGYALNYLALAARDVEAACRFLGDSLGLQRRDVEFGGCPMKEGDRVLMNFPGGNRDPEVFERPDEVVIDRARNRHLAFGVGIHRCAGSNQARTEMIVALEEWLARIPEFELEDPDAVTWAAGQVRGPRQLPLVFG